MDILNNEYVAQKECTCMGAGVKAVRAATRPSSMDYVKKIFKDFFELHGDRYFSATIRQLSAASRC